MITENKKNIKKIIKCVYCNSVNISKVKYSNYNKQYRCNNCGIEFNDVEE